MTSISKRTTCCPSALRFTALRLKVLERKLTCEAMFLSCLLEAIQACIG